MENKDDIVNEKIKANLELTKDQLEILKASLPFLVKFASELTVSNDETGLTIRNNSIKLLKDALQIIDNIDTKLLVMSELNAIIDTVESKKTQEQIDSLIKENLELKEQNSSLLVKYTRVISKLKHVVNTDSETIN